MQMRGRRDYRISFWDLGQAKFLGGHLLAKLQRDSFSSHLIQIGMVYILADSNTFLPKNEEIL